MPHLPPQFRPVPGVKAPLSTPKPITDLPVTPEAPRTNKPEVPISGKPRVRKYGSLERISMAKFDKSPQEIMSILQG